MSKADEIENWFNIPEYENYQASTNGRIRNSRGKILKPSKNNKGYYLVVLNGKSLLVHRLVAKTFIPNPNDYKVVNHINGIKTDNRFKNLEYTTQQDNCKKAWEKGLCENVREKAYTTKRKITIKTSRKVAQMHINGTIINVFNSIREAERKTGISNGNISRCCRKEFRTAGGYAWKYISDEELQAINEKVKELRIDRKIREER